MRVLAAALLAGLAAGSQQLASSSSMLDSLGVSPNLHHKITEIAKRAKLNARSPSRREHEAQPQHVLKQMVIEAGKDVSALEAQLKTMFKGGLRRGSTAFPSTIQLEAIQSPTHNFFPANATMMACLPEFLGAVTSENSTLSFSSACLAQNTASLSVLNGNSSTLQVSISSSNGGLFCNDFYLLATPEDFQLVEISAAGTTSRNFTISEATKGWVERNGIRVFRFLHDPITTVLDLIDTVAMFLPSLASVSVDPASQARNIGFLQQYVLGPAYQPAVRPNPEPLTAAYPYIQSGDLIMVQRLDGLGVLEDWGTGAVTTHTVVAMRKPEDPSTLYFTESTSHDSYWPIEGIQTNPVDFWSPIAYNASFAVVHVPLSDAARKAFDVTKAWQFVDNAVANHYPYGYRNFIATFFDTGSNNPFGASVPWPASAEFVEVVFGLLSAIPEAESIVEMLIGEGLSIRLGMQGKGQTFLELLDLAGSKGLTFADAVAIPEQDSWVYSNGPNMVCDVYYCNILKAAGVFGDLDFNCREFHNLDVYRLNIYNTTAGDARPQVCKDNDPNLPYCQLMGTYQLDLNVRGQLNTMAPYSHMNERCTALPLNYTRYPTMQC